MPKESGMLDLMKWAREAKLAVYGVTPVKVGLLEYAKFSTYDLQTRAFLIDTIDPKSRFISDALTLEVLPAFNKGKEPLTFKFDAMKMSWSDMSELVRVLSMLYDRAALTPNDIIELTGFGKIYDEGNDHYVGERNKRAGELQQDAVQKSLDDIGRSLATFDGGNSANE